jgi:hypothetical protein
MQASHYQDKKPLYPEVPGLTKSDKPKSMAFN